MRHGRRCRVACYTDLSRSIILCYYKYFKYFITLNTILLNVVNIEGLLQNIVCDPNFLILEHQYRSVGDIP